MNIELLGDEQIYEKFKDYLVCCGYKEFTPKGQGSTAFDYPARIKYVVLYEKYKSCIEIVKNIKGLLKEYDIGGRRETVGQKSHAAVINALKRFAEFLVYAQNNMNIYSYHLIKDNCNIDLFLKENKIDQIDNVNVQNINKLFTLVIHDVYGDETAKVYISDIDKGIDALKILPTTTLALALLNKNVGDVFYVDSTEYLVENIQEI